MLTVADRGRGGKICQNLADVICERLLNVLLFDAACDSHKIERGIGIANQM